MSLDLADYGNKARKAVKAFWKSRDKAAKKQKASGKSDQGGRAGVTAGKNMDKFADLICDIVRANGLSSAQIYRKRAALTLPGYFRPTKLWDILVIHKGELIAAIELKSHVGSFGNNFNNRAEEAIGTAHDFRTATRKGAFGQQPCPFVGWLILVEDAPKSRSSVKTKSPYFKIFEDFKDASYLQRYDLLCQKLVQEQLYTRASVITSPHSADKTGNYSELSSMTSLKAFVASLAGHIAATEARLGHD